ncbi:MAG TPA: OmpA family protein [Polyangia bacterium]|jgi:outer membrane protein OmpA-like peptidoglycan-associated protein|nr:OmpA family protein [Polyangia bacterium]
MRPRATGLLIGVSALFTFGCASTPKPKEIAALEDLRSDPTLSDPDRRAFDLLAAADGLLVQASRAWEHHDAEAARRDALMGQIKMKTALALLQAERLKARGAELDAELAISNDEENRLDAELATAEEEVSLLERLQAIKLASAAEKKALSAAVDVAKKQAATERQKLAEQLASEKRQGEAQHGIRVLELTLKIAETVDAPHYAKAAYTAATGMLQDAHKELDAGHWDESLARATLAQAEAEKGIALARPLYEKEAQALSNRARDRELEADATSIAGVRTRLEREGDLQRLVLTFHDLFGDKRASLRPEQAKVVDAVKDLLNKYPTYPLQLTGFADEQGKPDDLVALSLARANAVYWALVGRGIDPKRVSVDGKGSASGSSGSRVELSILYHGAD